MLNDNSEDMSGESATMVAYHLYHIAEDTNKLSQTDADLFHHFVEQLLYLKNQARKDIQLTVLFLLTIVIYLDTDDYNNLEREIKYIQGTIDPQFILSIDKSDNKKWYVDATFAVHKDMRIQNGGFTTIVTGRAHVQYSKQKLNNKMSTEADIVRVDNIMTHVIWNQYFLKEQIYEIHDNFIYQNDQSTIKPEKNGRLSSSKRTRNINIRYYLSLIESRSRRHLWNSVPLRT